MEIFSSRKRALQRLAWQTLAFIVFGGMCVNGLFISRAEMTSLNWIFLILYAGIALVSLFSALKALPKAITKTERQISIDDKGIRFFSKGSGSIFMTWSDLKELKPEPEKNPQTITFKGVFSDADSKISPIATEYFEVGQTSIRFQTSFSEQSGAQIYDSIKSLWALA